MSQTTPKLSQCPKCGQSVPDWAQVCQFCGTLMPNRPQIKRAVINSATTTSGYRWQIYAYTIASCWWLLQGVRIVLASIRLIPETASGIGQMFVGTVYIGIAVGLFLVLLGVGLIVKFNPARGVVNVFCWIQVLGGLFGIAGGVLSSAFFGIYGFISVILSVVDVLTAGLMIYLIGETDEFMS